MLLLQHAQCIFLLTKINTPLYAISVLLLLLRNRLGNRLRKRTLAFIVVAQSLISKGERGTGKKCPPFLYFFCVQSMGHIIEKEIYIALRICVLLSIWFGKSYFHLSPATITNHTSVIF